MMLLEAVRGSYKSVDQKLQITGLDYGVQAVLSFSCKVSVPLIKPVTTISTGSGLRFFLSLGDQSGT